MNNARRKQLNKALDLLEEARCIIEECADDEQCSLDNMPENLQGSERYSKSENAVSCMDQALTDLEDASDNINTAIE